MEKNQVVVAVTYIICGELLQLFNGIGSGWASAVTAIVQALLYIIPFLGGIVAPPIALAALLVALFGWIRIQEDLLGGFA